MFSIWEKNAKRGALKTFSSRKHHRERMPLDISTDHEFKTHTEVSPKRTSKKRVSDLLNFRKAARIHLCSAKRKQIFQSHKLILNLETFKR